MTRVGITVPKVLSYGLSIILAILFLRAPCSAMGQGTRVMTYNLFIGAEIISLTDASNVQDFQNGVKNALDQVAANDFRERAATIASLIIEKNPYLIGLQEVYNIRSLAGLNGEPPFLDYEAELIAALSAQGACYEAAAAVINLDFGPIPVPTYGPVSIQDRDVILVQCGIETEVVDFTQFSYCRPSADGCNFSNVAVSNTPVGDISFERGYVAVDTIYGRFVNTHLEIRDPDPDHPLSPLVQRAQAMELIAAIDVANFVDSQPGPVVIVGDINSSPEDPDVITGFKPPYMQLAERYVDAWTLRPGKPKGLTCCFDQDLSAPADLYERVDVIFSNQIPKRVKANVLGNDEQDQTPSGFWPSDHAGVAARIWF